MRRSFLIFILTSISVFAQDAVFKKLNWGIPSPYIKEIEADRESFYIATAGGLLIHNVKSGKERTIRTANGLPENYITALAVSPDESELWIGTPSGVARMNIQNSQITVFNRAKKQLSDDRVNTIVVDHHNVYIGTALGVDIYDRERNKFTAYTAIEGLAGNNVQALRAEGSIIWAGGADGISYYDRNDDLWVSFGSENGLRSNLVTSLSLDADAIWVGTAGGGLARFDRASEYFEMFSSDYGLVDDNIQSMSDDGNHLWAGTFGGLSKMEKKALSFQNYGNQNGISEPSVTSTAVRGEKLYIGTDGAGLFTYDKQTPQVQFSYSNTKYKKPGELLIYGTALSSHGFTTITTEIRSLENVNSAWSSDGVEPEKVSSGTEILFATVKTGNLPDGRYQVRISANDQSGKKNVAYGTVVVDNVAPKIDLFFRKPKPGEKEVSVSGRYLDLNLDQLEVYIGKRKVVPDIDRRQSRFRFPYSLESGAAMRVIATDIAGNRTEIKRTYSVDSEAPKLTLNPVDPDTIKGNLVEITGVVEEQNIDQVIVNPGQIIATITPAGDNRYEFKAQAPIRKEGLYTFQVSASDQGARTTTKQLTLKFYSEYTIVQIDDDKIPERTLKDNVEISGTVLGPVLKELYIEPGHRVITLDKDKTFSYKLSLAPGENKFTLFAVHANEQQDKFDFTVTSSQDKVEARIPASARTYSTADVSITGEYDPGITSVLVNRKKVELQTDVRTFTFDLHLNEGKNTILLTSVDELKRVQNKNVDIYLDKSKPDIYIRTPPAQTGLQDITLRGKIRDLLPVTISGYPGLRISWYNPENSDFEAKLHLQPGTNRVFIKAVDGAGNIAQKSFTIQYGEEFAKIEEAPGAASEAEIEELRKQIEDLQKQLAKQGSRARPVYSIRTVPRRSAVVAMPNVGRNRSYALAAKTYLGSEVFGDLLARYNSGRSARDKRVLIPTPELYRMISTSRYENTYEGTFIESSRAWNRGDSLSLHLVRHYTRNRQLKRISEGRGYVVLFLKNGAVIAVNEGGASLSEIRSRYNGEILLATTGKNELSFRTLR